MHDDFKSKLKIGILILLFIGIASYALYRTRALIAGVHLEVHGVTQYESRTDPLVTISGNAKRATELLINGRVIYITKDGDFSEQLLLFPGYNIIKIEATDKFGKQKEETLYLNLISKEDTTEKIIN